MRSSRHSTTPGRAECPQAAQLAALTANLSRMQCRPVDLERCVTPGSLRELASGGCFHLAGRHRLAAPLMLPCPVHIVGVGRAVLSGGAEVVGWSPWGEAEAGSPAGSGWRSEPTAPIRQLFAASRRGELGPLTRLPRAHAAARPFRLSASRDGFVGAARFCEWATAGEAPLELIYRGRNWSEPRCTLLGVRREGASCVLAMQQPCHHNVCPQPGETGDCRGVRMALRIENAPQALQPGQWAQRHDGRVLLRRGNATAPLPHVRMRTHGEDQAATVDAAARQEMPSHEMPEMMPEMLLAPRAEGLLVGLNVSVRRLRFTLGAFTPPKGVGFAETQAGHYASGWRQPRAAPAGRVCPVSAAVVGARGTITRCVFSALGGAGVHLHAGGLVSHSTFRDLSGGAILLGGVDHSAPRRGMAARCNAVRQPGAEYSGSVGIWGGYLIGASVQGNTVEQTPYSAISLGWGCGAERLNPDPGP